jgi:REP-associated tyrosine transposase
MPRIPRGQQAGFVYHVINRGNGRATIFHKPQDYQGFLSIPALAKARHPVKMFGFSLMPNDFHFVIEASHHQSLSRFMQWLLTSHVRRYHKHYGSSGHVWQGRFKSFPVQRDRNERSQIKL